LFAWRASPEGRLAEIIVLDQFSRNVYRDTPRAFAQDPLALALAQELLGGGHDRALTPDQRTFAYMPYMHSESALVQAQSVELFTQLGQADSLRSALRHREIIDRFGRFPHRNAILGRSSSAQELAKKYKTDHRHAEHVAMFAQQIFRELRHLHNLEPKHELLLRVAAILHEVGMFVNAREHHKHSMYLILNTELFGISTEDRIIVALLARYHRRYNPESNHPHFSELSREERMVVFKLAAILRIADCLDRSHSQRIKTIHLRPKGDRLSILTPGVEDTTIEQLAIHSKCDLFREIFGFEVLLSRS
jgi:uncharacterized protein (DUF924 family)